MMTKLKKLLTSGVAAAFAFALTAGLVYGQAEPDVPEETPDITPPPVEEHEDHEMHRDDWDVPTTESDVENGTRDSLADELVRDNPDTDKIQKHLEEAFIASGVGPEEAAEKAEELARKIQDALAESETETDEFDVEEDDTYEYEGTEEDTEDYEEDDNGGLW